MKYKFPALIVKEEDGFLVEFPDLEDAFTQGDTWEEAFENAEDVLNLMLWNREENNIPIPHPSSIDEIDVPANATIALFKADTKRPLSSLNASFPYPSSFPLSNSPENRHV